MRRVLLLFGLLCLVVAPVAAQDPVKVDAKHYKVVVENDQVRVLRITYGPKEKSVMHDHPSSVAVFLTDMKVRFHLPDGKTQEQASKAGEAQFIPAGKHLPESLGDKPMELILVELKGKPAPAPAPAKAPPKKQ